MFLSLSLESNRGINRALCGAHSMRTAKTFMDSIISNTSWAFIKSLGYDIADFKVSSSESSSESYITISLSSFSFVFVDIVQQTNSVTSKVIAATLRPIMVPSNGSTKPYSLWMISRSNDGISYLTNSACSIEPNFINSITTTSTSVTLSASFHFYSYPIYVAAYAVA